MSKSAKKSPSRPKTAQATSIASERKPALSIIKDIQPDAGAGQTRRQYTAEEKIRIVLEGLQGEQSVAEICRREGLNTNIYYRWIGPDFYDLSNCGGMKIFIFFSALYAGKHTMNQLVADVIDD